jgi:hypothetical protein
MGFELISDNEQTDKGKESAERKQEDLRWETTL